MGFALLLSLYLGAVMALFIGIAIVAYAASHWNEPWVRKTAKAAYCVFLFFILWMIIN